MGIGVLELRRDFRIPVRAIVKALTDEELAIAQAKENLERQDLSYIERALLARQLEERQFDRAMIMGALGVDKGDLSRLLSVAHGVPADLILAIGPAPRIGRPRWVQLAELVKSAVGLRCAMAAVADELFEPRTQIAASGLSSVPCSKKMPAHPGAMRL